MKIAKYRLLYTDDPKIFERDMNKALESGWQPYGELIVIQGPKAAYMQQMIMIEEEQ